ncbi:DsbA family protein [Candidatus Aenigmatarchaeota archaeon]
MKKTGIIAIIIIMALLSTTIAFAFSYSVTKDDDPIMGPKVTIIEFGNYAETFSLRFFDNTLPLIKENYIEEGKVMYVFRDYPFEWISDYAVKSAEASECADEQGVFWNYHDLLFNNQESWKNAPDMEQAKNYFRSYARRLRLDMDEFNSCLDSGIMEEEVLSDRQDAEDAEVYGIPTFFIQADCGFEERIDGAQQYHVFEEAIGDALDACEPNLGVQAI